MNKLPLLFIALVTSVVSFAQDSASVLFIGNSYTYGNDLPLLLNNVTNSLGDAIYNSSQTPGGATFEVHTNNPQTFSKIAEEQWDYVVLQAQSQEPSFPDAQVDTGTIPYAKELADSIYANKFCSEVLMFMTWGRENGDPQWGPISTFEGMNDRLRNAYLRMADTVQGSVSPVGVAWRYIRDNHPTIDLYTADGSHPSFEGSYLAACTFYASIFRKSPVGASYIGSLDAGTAAILQGAASMVVLDSLDQWNLRPLSEHTQAEYSYTTLDNNVTFTNESTKALTYEWNFGDGNTSTEEHPIHAYGATGDYTVTLIATSPCDTDTITYSVSIDALEIDEVFANISIAHIGQGKYSISGIEGVNAVKVFTMDGRESMISVQIGEKVDVTIENGQSGIYIIVFETHSGVHSMKVPY